MSVRKRVTSPDNWFPTGDDGKVEVSVHRDALCNWRVAVWGKDDFGLEIYGLSINEADSLFNEIVDGVTKDDLRKRGFVPA